MVMFSFLQTVAGGRGGGENSDIARRLHDIENGLVRVPPIPLLFIQISS